MSKYKKSWDYIVFNFIGKFYLILCMLLCLIPFYLIVMGSLSDNLTVVKNGFSLWPKKFSAQAYQLIFSAPKTILNAYGVTIFVTLVGSLGGLFLITLTAYALFRMDKRLSSKIGFFIYFTTMFGGGLVPWYILIVRYLHLKNNLLILILPMMFNVVYIFLMRNFIKAVPQELVEAALVEGAGEFNIFFYIIIPLLKPALATIGLYLALNYWNDWFHAMLFISKDTLYPIQYYLYQLLYKIDALNSMANQSGIPLPDMPTETFKLAVTTITIAPILLLYPFLQKYFVGGMMSGAVKG